MRCPHKAPTKAVGRAVLPFCRTLAHTWMGGEASPLQASGRSLTVEATSDDEENGRAQRVGDDG